MYVDWKLEHLNAQYSNAELQFFLIVSVTVVLIALGLVANYLIRKKALSYDKAFLKLK